MSKRIEYIDYLKGLSIIWVIWYHTTHPAFVDYSFRIPLFFFVSGIFFRPYPLKKFLSKKINTLIIPFIFFYIIYYLFYIALWFIKYKNLTEFDFSNIFQLFGLYKGYENFVINPPLWFICALLNLQILLYLIVRIINNKIAITLVAIALTLLGIFYSFEIPTPFMIGRSLNYFIYYTMGYLIGSNISSLVSKFKFSPKSKLLLIISSLTIVSCVILKQFIPEICDYVIKFINYVEIFAIIIVLMFLFNAIYKYSVFSPFKFFGINSYIVLGMHEIYHTINYIIIRNAFGEVTVSLGIIQTIVTLLMLWPTILLLNKFVPKLVGKTPLLKV